MSDSATSDSSSSRNPYRHDHNPLNEDFHGGICAACEWETDDVGIPSVDVCSFCADPECDGIGCIGSLDSNETADHDTIEQLHDLIRAGAAWKIMQTHGYVVAERALAHAEHRVAHEFGVEVCGAKHPTSWWITCQLDTDHFGEHVRDCPPVEVGERLKFSQLTVHWQDPCECDSHTGVGEDLWKCDECGEVIRYVDDPQGRIVVTTLHPYNDRRVRVEMVTPGDRPGNREWWT